MLKRQNARRSADRSIPEAPTIIRDAVDETDAYFVMKKIKARAKLERLEISERNKRNGITLPKLSWMERR